MHLRARRLPQDPPSTTTKLGQSQRNRGGVGGRGAGRDERKRDGGKNRGGMRVNRSGRIERRGRGGGKKANLCRGRTSRHQGGDEKEHEEKKRREGAEKTGRGEKKFSICESARILTIKKPSATAEPLSQTPLELGESALEKNSE